MLQIQNSNKSYENRSYYIVIKVIVTANNFARVVKQDATIQRISIEVKRYGLFSIVIIIDL